MKDRVSLHPGRVVLTPVPGQTNTYDMTMADQPTQVGDPPTKANLLSDATVAALNAFLTSALPANPKVTDALKSLATVGLGKIAYGSYIGTGTYGSSNPCRLTFPFTPKILIITAYGTPSSTSTTQKTYFLAVIGQSGGSAISGAAGWIGMAIVIRSRGILIQSNIIILQSDEVK